MGSQNGKWSIVLNYWLTPIILVKSAHLCMLTNTKTTHLRGIFYLILHTYGLIFGNNFRVFSNNIEATVSTSIFLILAMYSHDIPILLGSFRTYKIMFQYMQE